jgi:hypothetical protein
MRSYGMYDASRGLTLALAAGLAGLALWGATQVGTQTPGRFWLAMAIVAAGGLVLALTNHVGTWTKGLRLRLSPSTFVLAFLPVLVCVGWILLASQPGKGWQEGRIHSWSSTIGILGLVHDVGLWSGVLAFGFGLLLGLSFDGVPAPMVETEPVGGVPADEPVAAERRYSADGRAPAPSSTPTGDTERMRERTPAR